MAVAAVVSPTALCLHTEITESKILAFIV